MMLTHSPMATTLNKRAGPSLPPVPVAGKVETSVKRQKVTEQKSTPPLPVEYLTTVFNSSAKGKSIIQDKSLAVFSKPAKETMDAYDLEVVQAIRTKDVDKLRSLRAAGKSMDACNKFGESLIHMACRRGDVPVVKFLVEEAHVKLSVKDDFGRTPLHDACWTPEPNFDLMDVLLKHCPVDSLLAEDVRGHTPFHYARQDHWAKWVDYFRERNQVLSQRLESYQVVG